MSKSWKLMTAPELIDEIARVKELLITNKDYFTQKQNRKYLEKLEKEYKIYEHFNNHRKT